ncbi:cellulose-binding domain-containing protein [Nonomuraea angiospora]|uniref:cellulose-binding domain-containing protein n=1 Tax=Nonomuraea angiospora TaxID=46172 RepID=UPI0029AA089B|nr:cellulose-binding domain-containing protein [Nonomuraea angiospora]MDX3111432.1 cellulose-binding domain-containing protein [Nonomuraea angiospora]
MRLRGLRRGLIAGVLAVCMAGAAVASTITAHAAAAGCQVTYTLGSQWTGGFSANVAIKNLGDPLTSWTLRWSFGAAQTVSQAWNAVVTQSGSAVTAADVGWNGSLPTNGSASFGFNGTWNNSTNPVPASFTLNGVTCTGTVTPTATPTVTPTSGPPPSRTVRVYWLKPSDVAYDQRYPDGIAKVMQEAQRFFKQQLGKTFTLNNPVVEVVNGDQPRTWYENTPNCGEKYWWTVCNMQAELRRKLGLGAPDNRWVNVGEISAEGDGAGGGGGNGWVILSGHDADGAAGINGAMNRWYGGMVHELGHAFGLPDATSTDGTCMSATFYSYPNCIFNQTQKNGMLNGPYGSFLT